MAYLKTPYRCLASATEEMHIRARGLAPYMTFYYQPLDKNSFYCYMFRLPIVAMTGSHYSHTCAAYSMSMDSNMCINCLQQ
jgi:hypothetical protein